MKKSLIIFLVLIVFIVVCAAGTLLFLNFQKSSTKKTATKQDSGYKNISFDVVSEWNDHYKLHVMYPITENAIINNTVRTQIDEYVVPFRQEVATSASKSTRPYDLNIVGAVNFANDYAVNLVYNGSEYDGVQENPVEISQFYNRQTGAVITTAQLFSNQKYISTLSSVVQRSLPDILKTNYNKTLAEQGASAKAENFNNFELVDDKIVNLVFEPGQVAAEAVGVVKVPIQIEMIDDYFNDAEVNKIFPDFLVQLRQNKVEDMKQIARKNIMNVPPISVNTKTDCKVNKCIALTFDDGPGGATTQTVLDTLNKNNAKATFFMIGRQIPAQAALVKSIAASGHEIGNHTWDHIDMAFANATTLHEQIDKTAIALIDALGKRPVLVRPPYGSFTATTLKTVAQPFIMWSVDPKDWQDKNADIVYQRVMAGAKPGAIVLSHDIHATTAEAYKRIIPALKAQGYTFVTVSDLLDLDANNPLTKSYTAQ